MSDYDYPLTLFDEDALEIPVWEDESFYAPEPGYEPNRGLDPFLPDDERLIPEDDWLEADWPPTQQDGLQGFEMPEPDNEQWSWRDARLVGIVREGDSPRYEIGCLEHFTNLHTGERSGQYLRITDFSDQGVAESYFHDLQSEVFESGTAAHDLAQFAERVTAQMSGEAPEWSTAHADELAAYDYAHSRDVQTLADRDDPSDSELESLLDTARNLGSAEPDIPENEMTAALNAIGVTMMDFDASENAPPYFDAQTGVAYWIGIFQPDADDRETCVTSILSLGRHPDTGALEAQLAPCVPGDWDKTHAAADYLIQIAEREGMERCFDAAEGMALATEQRDLWERKRGLALDMETTVQVADYARELWEVSR